MFHSVTTHRTSQTALKKRLQITQKSVNRWLAQGVDLLVVNLGQSN